MIPSEAAEALRQFVNLPRQQVAIWLYRGADMKPGENPIIRIAIKPEAEQSTIRSKIPGNFQGYAVEKMPWSIPHEGDVPKYMMEK